MQADLHSTLKTFTPRPKLCQSRSCRLPRRKPLRNVDTLFESLPWSEIGQILCVVSGKHQCQLCKPTSPSVDACALWTRSANCPAADALRFAVILNLGMQRTMSCFTVASPRQRHTPPRSFCCLHFFLPCASVSLSSLMNTLMTPSGTSSTPSSNPGLTPTAMNLPSAENSIVCTLAGNF